MNLKEAFQAQNKLSELMTHITRYLSAADNVMTSLKNTFAARL